MDRWIALTAVALTLGCTTTRIVDTWRAPGLEPSDLRFEHLVVLAVTASRVHRHIAEDAVAATAERTRVSPGYSLVADADRGDTERVRQGLTAAGVDGAIVLRLIGAESKETYVPGQTHSVYGGFYGYYGHISQMGYDPGYVRSDTYVRIETSLVDVASGKMLWSAISETINPSSLDPFMKEVAEAAGRELREQGLVP